MYLKEHYIFTFSDEDFTFTLGYGCLFFKVSYVWLSACTCLSLLCTYVGFFNNFFSLFESWNCYYCHHNGFLGKNVTLALDGIKFFMHSRLALNFLIFRPPSLLFCWSYFSDRVFQCGPGCSRTHYVYQAASELTCLPMLPKCWIKGMYYHIWMYIFVGGPTLDLGCLPRCTSVHCMSVYHVFAWYQTRLQESAGPLEAGVADACESVFGAGN